MANDGYVLVYEPGTTWLLFRYDPQRHLVEIQRKGRKFYVDLRILDEQQSMKDRIHTTKAERAEIA